MRARGTFALLATREPSATESSLLAALYGEQLEQFQREPAAAEKLIHIGDSKPDATLAPAELAAATVMAQAVLNLDATIWQR